MLGRYPFNPEGEEAIPLSEFELLHVITNDPIPKVPEGYSKEFADFIRATTIRDPKLRPSPKQLFDTHPFVRLAQQFKPDMIGWARSYLEPNLDDRQKERWSTSVKEKRMSVMADRRRR